MRLNTVFVGLLCCCLCITVQVQSQAQNNTLIPGKYYLYGEYAILKQGTSIWCADKNYELIPLANAKSYDSAKIAFFSKYKKAEPETRLITPYESFVIYKAQKNFVEFNCKYQFFGIVKAPTVDSAKAKLAQMATNNKSISQVQEAYALENNTLGDIVINKKHNGLLVNIVVRNRERKPFTQLKFTNTTASATANIAIKQYGKTINTTKIAAQQVYNTYIQNEEEFTYEATFEAPKAETTNISNDMINYIKQKVGETIKATKPNATGPIGGIGIRG